MTATITTVMVLIAIREGINNNKWFKEKAKGIPIPGELMVVSGMIIIIIIIIIIIQCQWYPKANNKDTSFLKEHMQNRT